MTHFLELGDITINVDKLVCIKIPNYYPGEDLYKMTITYQSGKRIIKWCPYEEYKSFVQQLFTIYEAKDFLEQIDETNNIYLIKIEEILAIEHGIEQLTDHFMMLITFLKNHCQRLELYSSMEKYQAVQTQLAVWKNKETSPLDQILDLLQSLVYAPGGPMSQNIKEEFFLKASKQSSPKAVVDGEPSS